MEMFSTPIDSWSTELVNTESLAEGNPNGKVSIPAMATSVHTANQSKHTQRKKKTKVEKMQVK